MLRSASDRAGIRCCDRAVAISAAESSARSSLFIRDQRFTALRQTRRYLREHRQPRPHVVAALGVVRRQRRHRRADASPASSRYTHETAATLKPHSRRIAAHLVHRRPAGCSSKTPCLPRPSPSPASVNCWKRSRNSPSSLPFARSVSTSPMKIKQPAINVLPLLLRALRPRASITQRSSSVNLVRAPATT